MAEAKDWSEGAEAFRDINPAGPMAHDLPHTYLPLTGFDRHYKSGEFVDDEGTCCQFTAGGLRCQGTRWEHERKWPELVPGVLTDEEIVKANEVSARHIRRFLEWVRHQNTIYDYEDGQAAVFIPMGGPNEPSDDEINDVVDSFIELNAEPVVN